MAAAFGRHNMQTHSYSFMTCILRVKTHAPGWQRAVRKVLSKIHGVNSFRMNEDGTVVVSGMVDRPLLLKMIAKAGRHVQVCWLQFGDCSSNLYAPMPIPKTSICDHIDYGHHAYEWHAYNRGASYYEDHGHPGYGWHGYSYHGDVDPYGGQGYYGGYTYPEANGYWNHHRPARHSHTRPFGGLARCPTPRHAPFVYAVHEPPLCGEGLGCCSLM